MPQGFQATAPVRVLDRGPGGQSLLPLYFLLVSWLKVVLLSLGGVGLLENIQDAL